MPETFEGVVAKVRDRARPGVTTWALRGPKGQSAQFGPGEPVFEVVVHNDAGLAAAASFSELAIAEAYINGDIDFGGDLFQVMELRHLVQDREWYLTTWAQLSPLVLGRRRLNPRWIAKHYDSKNVQVFGLDRDFAVYTPGIYDGDDDTLEAGSARKLEYAFSSLGLKSGSTLLDVGCGWGGFLRYCARRGVEVTGITLSRHQLEYSKARLKEDGLDGKVVYQDFFTFEPGRRFDGISMMGVMEDLSDYDLVMKRLRGLLAPEGRMYCDFAASPRRYGIASVVTKYVWPGKFRMVYMPQFIRAAAAAGFDMIEVQNDRRNYHLWTKKAHQRWLERRDEALAVVNEPMWRLMRLLMAGVSHSMGPTAADDTAYRMVLGWRSPANLER
ncbi:MAG: class I SAM-dependent methyltransferase [Actinomycetota bacterium]|nr:class I SAM-dependent methyltransferase [Actinomycetota bacterium]